jgi:hypothetical protein
MQKASDFLSGVGIHKLGADVSGTLQRRGIILKRMFFF